MSERTTRQQLVESGLFDEVGRFLVAQSTICRFDEEFPVIVCISFDVFGDILSVWTETKK